MAEASWAEKQMHCWGFQPEAPKYKAILTCGQKEESGANVGHAATMNSLWIPPATCLTHRVSHLRDRFASIRMRHMSPRTSHICLAIAAAVCGLNSGCALPVIEGVFDSRDFAIFNDTPEARGQSGDEVLLVFLEIDDSANALRTVSVDLRDLTNLPVGEVLDVGTGAFGDARPNVEVVEGTIVRDSLADGGELISTGDDAKRASSLAGTLTLETNEAGHVVGSFRVDLDDGGYLAGRFASKN